MYSSLRRPVTATSSLKGILQINAFVEKSKNMGSRDGGWHYATAVNPDFS